MFFVFMITYNDIYEAARKERYSEQLQQIPKNFVSEFSKYLKEKKKLLQKRRKIFQIQQLKQKNNWKMLRLYLRNL